MATATTTTSKKAKTVKVTAKADLVELEKAYKKKYPKQHIIEGSIRQEKDGDHAGKISVLIKCQGKACTKTRRVATSDLHQCAHCEDCVAEIRQERRRTARAGKRKAKPAKPAKAKKEKPAKDKTKPTKPRVKKEKAPKTHPEHTPADSPTTEAPAPVETVVVETPAGFPATEAAATA